jgi:FMN phosphatase YigB (HAD superfamily)
MAIKAVLFDLDGTLLPMQDQNRFIKTYFGALTEYMAAYGYDAEEFVAAMWQSVGAMMKNDGSQTNESAFWSEFIKIYGERGAADREHVDDFYKNGFAAAKVTCGYTESAKETLELVRSLGLRAVLATNPVFPRVATEARIGWAGLDTEDFELITTYENSSYSKPTEEYYREILKALALTPEECVMVGNDTRDDMSAAALGMRVFLLTDCLINEAGEDISKYPHGDFSALAEYLKSLN